MRSACADLMSRYASGTGGKRCEKITQPAPRRGDADTHNKNSFVFFSPSAPLREIILLFPGFLHTLGCPWHVRCLTVPAMRGHRQECLCATSRDARVTVGETPDQSPAAHASPIPGSPRGILPPPRGAHSPTSLSAVGVGTMKGLHGAERSPLQCKAEQRSALHRRALAISAMPLHGQDVHATFHCRPQGRRYNFHAAQPR